MEVAAQTVWELAQGNKRYAGRRGVSNTESKGERSVVEMLIEDPLRPTPPKAIVISCARSYAPIDAIFDTSPGQLQVIRIIGNVCRPHDGVSGSVEFALGEMRWRSTLARPHGGPIERSWGETQSQRGQISRADIAAPNKPEAWMARGC
jgi:hypothetical protein